MFSHNGDILASFSKIAQGCQGGTRRILNQDGLIYQKMQKNFVHTPFPASTGIRHSASGLVGIQYGIEIGADI